MLNFFVNVYLRNKTQVTVKEILDKTDPIKHNILKQQFQGEIAIPMKIRMNW